MIVISGALVLVAAVLLILGIVSSITLVYAAIGLSIVSAVFLLVGVFQRPAPAGQSRPADGGPAQEPATGSTGLPGGASPVAAKPVQTPPNRQAAKQSLVKDVPEQPAAESADYPLEAADPELAAAAVATGAEVTVISGRPRYHLSGCTHVEGEAEAEPLDIAEACELGFTPCGTCRPNETLARGAAGNDQPAGPAKPVPSPALPPEDAAPAAPSPAAAEPDVTPESAAPPQPATVAAAAIPTPNSAANSAAASAPAAHAAELNGQSAGVNGSAPVANAAAAPAVAPPPVAAPISPPPVAAPVRGASGASPEPATDPSQPAAAAPVEPVAGPSSGGQRSGRSGRTVVAVAASKEYHRPGCELLGADEAAAAELTKVAAIRQGYLACGTCRP